MIVYKTFHASPAERINTRRVDGHIDTIRTYDAGPYNEHAGLSPSYGRIILADNARPFGDKYGSAIFRVGIMAHDSTYVARQGGINSRFQYTFHNLALNK